MEKQKADKSSRKRKKKLLNSIREQIEFYFSDANLRRDRFMRQLVNGNDSQLNGTQFVDLDQFLKFNKISEMTSNIRHLSLAIESSKCLLLDETKLKVKRSTPFVDNKDNSDESTIYVERLPPNADQQWIRSVFKTYGNIDYVKLPRFKHNNNNMGFAFIEFESPLSAVKACRHFATLNERIAEDMKPVEEDLEDSVLEPVESESKPESESELSSQSVTKRCLDPNIDESVCAKKVKLLDENEVNTDLEEMVNKDMNCETEKKTQMDFKDKNCKKKKKRRRKRKTLNNTDSVEENEVEVINLRVMSKKEWKCWKNKYLKLQKTTMSTIKRSLLINCDNNKKEPEKLVSNEVEVEETFESGLIIKLNFTQSSNNLDELEFKRNIRLLAENAEIAYIDLPNNEIEFKDNQTISRVCYIRCKSSQIANQLLLNERLKQMGELCLLSGVQESNYWNKINGERVKKRENTNKNRKNIRGFDKIINRAEKVVTGISGVQTKLNKHIKFQ